MFTLSELHTAVWSTHLPRKLDGLAAGASNGTRIDSIRHAFWTYSTRTATALPTAFLGDTTAGGDSFPGNDDRAIVTRFTATENGTIIGGQAIFAATTTAGTSAKLIVLSNNAGTPGSVLAVSSGSLIPAGGGLVTFTISGTTITSGTEYFIGVVFNSFTAQIQEDSLVGQDTEMANGTFSYATPPATWPGTDGNYAVRLNVAVEYLPAGGEPNDITGTAIAGNSTVSGTLSAGRNISGGAVAGSSTASGSIRVGYRFSGSAVSQPSTVSGSLTSGRNIVGGAVSASSIVSGSLTNNRLITGSAISQPSTASGSLRKGYVISSSAVSGPSSAAGSLQAGRNITGAAIASSSTVSGSMAKSEAGFVGNAVSGPATVSGSLTAGRVISFDLQASSGVISGLLTKGASAQLSAVAGPATVSGNITVTSVRNITGAAVAQPATVSAILEAYRLITGNAVAQPATVSGSLMTTGYSYLVNLGPTVLIKRTPYATTLINKSRYDNVQLVKRL